MKKEADLKSEKMISLFSFGLIVVAVIVLTSMIYIFNVTVQRAERLDQLENQRSYCELAVQELLTASDDLTTEVRGYSADGQLRHLQNFWQEVDESRKRDKAIEKLLHSNLTEKERTHVLRAKSYSDGLIVHEAWSMRMLAEANGEALQNLPEQVQLVELSADDEKLSPAEKRVRAHAYLFGQDYTRSKSRIREMVNAFNVDLSKRLEYNTSSMLNANRQANRYALWSISLLMALMMALTYVYIRLVRQKNQQLKQALLEAEAASSAKSYFTSRMSHEIRTPLNAVLGYLHLAEQNEDSAQKTGFLVKCKIAATNLLGIVNDVLDLSAIENGRMQLAALPYSVTKLLQEMQIVYASIAASRGITLTVKQEKIVHEVVIGDRMRLNQILNNLMSNSLKFTPAGGTITLKGEQENLGDLVRMTYTVSDTGIGMNKDFLPHIYDAYEQEDVGIHQRYGGSGLGMSIVKSLVDFMQGTITVTSEKGQGSTFVVTIDSPVADQAAVAGLEGSDASNPGRAEACGRELVNAKCLLGMKLLLAEDNAMNMEIAKAILKKAGAQVTGAANGRIALQMFTASAPGTFDAILMDIIMPELNGYETTKQIRSSRHPDAAAIPIIAMSANAFASDVKQSLAAGMNDHVAKPIVVKRLLQALLKYYHKEE